MFSGSHTKIEPETGQQGSQGLACHMETQAANQKTVEPEAEADFVPFPVILLILFIFWQFGCFQEMLCFETWKPPSLMRRVKF